MIIKVCGMRDPANIRDIIGAGATVIGINFCAGSPRRADESLRAGVLAAAGRVPLAGVFMDAQPEAVAAAALAWRLRFVQLHGAETPAAVRATRAALDRVTAGVSVIKALAVREAADLARAALYARVADYALFDTKGALPGGNGRQFDWGLLEGYAGPLPFLLAGGIAPGDAARIRALRHPLFEGIDINSRFETAPGMKDSALVRAFLRELAAGARHTTEATE